MRATSLSLWLCASLGILVQCGGEVELAPAQEPSAGGAALLADAMLRIESQQGSPDLGELCEPLGRLANPQAEDLLRQLIEQSPHHRVRGLATLHLGLSCRRRAEASGDEGLMLSARGWLKNAQRDYPDVVAQANLSPEIAEEIHRGTAVGAVALEIAGEDIDGVPFKLSDYRGKVVVLDFWGHW